jgi:hypothetical protein
MDLQHKDNDMIEAIKKLISRKKIQNPANVPNELMELIHQDLGLINKSYAGVGERLWKYVIDGTDESIILKLAGLDKAAEALLMRPQGRYSGSLPKTSAARRELFRQIDALAPEVAYRLAKVYHAAWSAQQAKQRRWPHLASELEWLEIFICEGLSMGPWNSPGSHEASWSAQTFENILKAGDHPTDALAGLILLDEPQYGYAYFDQRAFDTIQGLGAYFSDHAGMIKKALSHPKAPHRSHVLEFLKKKQTDLTGDVVPVICDLAVGSAKTVRTAAELLLLTQSAETREKVATLLREKLLNGAASERVHAVGLLVKVEGDSCLGLLKACLETEKSKRMVAELEKYLMIKSESPETGSRVYEDGLIPPEPRAFDTEFTVTPEMAKDLLETVETYNAEAMEAHTKRWDRTDPRWRRGSRTIKPPISAGTVKFIYNGIETPELVKQRKQPGQNVTDAQLLYGRLAELIKRQDLPLVPIIRLGFLFGLIQSDDQKRYNPYSIQEYMVEWLARYKSEKDPILSLSDLAGAFTAAGLSEAWPAKLYLNAGYGSRSNPLNLADEEIWPFFHLYPVFLEDALGFSEKILTVRDFWKTEFRVSAFKVLATFPKPPQRFATFLWEQALGTSKTERPLAQACLVNYPGREKLIIAALDDGRKDIRTAAARWLGELKIAEAETPIRKALEREKFDEPKAQMMETLEILGVDIDRFLNRNKLKEEAETGLKKAVPKDLAWFPLDGLPEVHWEKSKQKVAPEIIQWFVVQAHKLKNPEPGPLQRRYFKLMRPDERARLGNFVLTSWLAQDTIPRYNHDEASRLADQQVAQTLQYVKQHPKYYPDFDEAQYRKSVLNHLLNECLGSANSSKGILAISAACCGSEIVAPVERYLKQWYGHRMAQCKALIRMLSWVDHPLAIQLILAIATRFRTKGIQKEAAICAQLIAERKGWTLDEMADRTIPTAGFDINGYQEIDYGVRKFTARLSGDFSIQLENESGRVIKNLPPANQMENEDEVKAVKKEFSAAKKEIKQVLKHQKERLYEAMCTQRRWRFEDWDMYLNNHPIVSRYCRNLVWMALEPGKTTGDAPQGQDPTSDRNVLLSFRPTSDRSLTDVDDETVELTPDHLVQVAHQSFLSEEDGRLWRQHLKDYEIEPLFEQFRESDFIITAERLEQRGIKDYEGYLINSFKLRSHMNRLGYTRGAAEDGGWFYTYHKNFPGLKRQAVIEFTGNVLPEENRTVGLMQLYFIEIQEDHQNEYAYAHRPLKLSEIPAVMVMECANDLKLLADEGSGYDDEWEKKTEY